MNHYQKTLYTRDGVDQASRTVFKFLFKIRSLKLRVDLQELHLPDNVSVAFFSILYPKLVRSIGHNAINTFQMKTSCGQMLLHVS